MPSQPWQHLTRINHHPRDDHIVFDEPTHKYYVNGSCEGNISCTGFVHEFFGHFDPKATLAKMRRKPDWATSKYFGKTDEQIIKEWSDSGKAASEAGTAMHLAIEQFLHGSPEVIKPEILETPEWRYFMKFWKDFGDDLEPYRSEWEVFTGSLTPVKGERKIKLCGSIDMVFRRKSTGKFVIYDWKRSREIKCENRYQSGLAPLDHLPDCNYWHYTLQLNVYKWILEKYYGLEIEDLYLIILHPDNPSYRRMRLNILEEEVEDMIECRRRAVEAGCKQSVILPVPGGDEDEEMSDTGISSSGGGKQLAEFSFKLGSKT
jgi:hypothetical protein